MIFRHSGAPHDAASCDFMFLTQTVSQVVKKPHQFCKGIHSNVLCLCFSQRDVTDF